nr:cytochrome p450 monooxygenase gsff [Quercus suber]
MFPLLSLVISTLLVASATYVIYQVFVHPLASFPGPVWARFSRLWMTKHSWNGDMNEEMIKLHRKHGEFVRTGPNELSISNLAAIKTIYGAGTKFRKSDWYSVWQGHRKFDLFAERDERVHSEQRRLVSRIYAMDSLKNLEPYVDSAVTVFLDQMTQRAGDVIDMGNWVQLFAFGEYNDISNLNSEADR